MQTYYQKISPLLKQRSAVLLLILAFLLLLFDIHLWYSRDRPVEIKYSGTSTCIRDNTIEPNDFRQKAGSNYSISYKDEIKIAGHPVLSRTTCFSLNKAPREDSSEIVSAGLSGTAILQKNYKVTAGKHPLLSTSPLNRDISIADPLVFNLDKSDKVFEYILNAGEESVTCKTKNLKVECDVRQLSLKQGSEYTIKLERKFKTSKISEITERRVNTVLPVNITSGSVTEKAVIYDKPSEFKLLADKKLTEATITLWQITPAERKIIEQETSIKYKEINVKPSKEMPRDTNYELIVESARSQDRGILPQPYKVNFKLSGGPRVASVNIGKSSVGVDASIVLTFDQPVSANQDFSKLIKLYDGTSTLAYTATASGQKVTIKPSQRLRICSHINLQLTADIKSLYDISGNSEWRYSSRAICHTLVTIGYSVKGQPIQAWRFGSGANKIIYVGATHGNEKSTKYLLDSWINELNAYPDKILASQTIIVIPNINPDGFAANSRRNANNVDLNRNFPTVNWKSNVTMPGGQLVVQGAGAEPLSEPETKALASLVVSEKPKLVLTYHSVASVVIGNGAGDSLALALTYAARSKYRNLPPAQTGDMFHYDTTGAFEDWLAEKQSIGCLVVELGSNTNSEFSRNKEAMWAMATSR